MIQGITDSNQKIVTNGLVLNLDSAQIKSYPETGTTWLDISSNNYSFNLVNGPTYDSPNQRSMYFNGTTAYANANATILSSASTKSVFAWVKAAPLTTTTAAVRVVNHMPNISSQFVLTFDSYLTPVNTYRIGGTPNNNVNYGYSTTYFPINTWAYIGYTWDGTTFTGYHNATQYSLADQIGGAFGFAGVTGVILGARTSTPATFLKGNLGPVHIYNYGLSNTEVAQNFNAQKSRFGL